MKNLFLICFSLLFVQAGFAQNTMKEGQMTFEVVDVELPESDDPNMKMMAGALKGTKLKISFDEDMFRMSMNMMGGMMKMGNIYSDSDASKNYMLFETFGKRIKVHMDEETMKTQEDMKKEAMGNDDFELTEDLKDTKEIEGYKCHKVTLTSKSNPDLKMHAYVTKEINLERSIIETFDSTLYGGVPLEFTMGDKNMGAQMKMLAKKIDSKVPKDAFAISDNYEEMTMEEFQDMMGEMSKMGGF